MTGKNTAPRTILRSITLVFRAAPWYILLFGAVSIAVGLLATWITVANNRLFDAVGTLTSGIPWTTVLRPLALAGFAVILRQLFGLLQRYLNRVTDQTVKGRLRVHLHTACQRLDAVDFENPEVLNEIDKADKGRASCMEFFMSIFDMLAGQLPYFISMGVYLYSLRPVLALSILMLAVPVLITQIVQVKMFSNLEDEVSPYRRQNEYFDRCISHREYFKETRLLGAYGYFFRLFRESLQGYCRASVRTEKRSVMYMVVSRVITLAGYVGVLFLLFYSLMDGFITVGAFAAVFASIVEIMQHMAGLFEMGFKGAIRNYGAVRNFIAFVDRPRKKYEKVRVGQRGAIQLRDVRFAYPGAKTETIKGITVSIAPGETLAVVGENGAGKSTLMRLITGEYAPTAGRVIVDGHDLSSITPAARYEKVSAVFQRFGKYRMTLRENVELSCREKSEEDFRRVLRDADIVLDQERSFPEKEETLLSREFGGVDISGGQWQRIAIARGLYRDHSLIILDEPTAAIDPMEETRLYKQFADISRDKTALIVTHRLGSARIADRIIVMKDGIVDDIGTHDELTAKGGYYAELYQSQAKWYS